MDSVTKELDLWMSHLRGVDSEVESASERIRRISRLLGRILTETAAHNHITVGDWESLSVLRRSGSSRQGSPKELSEKLGVTSGTISVRLDRLVKAGLVESVPSEGDGRSRPVKLTDEGDRIWSEATMERTMTERQLYDGVFDRMEIKQLNALLGKLLARFESELGPAPSHGSLRREAG